MRYFLTIFLMIASFGCYAGEIVYKVFQNQEIASYAEEIAKLQNEVFAEPPFKYPPNLDEFIESVKQYSTAKCAIACLAFDENKLIASATGIALPEAAEYYQAPFRASGMSLQKIFYLGEVLIREPYRNQGIGKVLYAHIENAVQNTHAFDFIYLCTLQPDEIYNPTRADRFWAGRGFKRTPGLNFSFPWVNIGEETETMHLLVFWEKECGNKGL